MNPALRKILLRLGSAALRPFFGGIGSILCLHRVVEPAATSRIRENTALEISPADLDNILTGVRENGFHLASMDEVHEILASRRAAKKFVAFSLDDGYLDNLETALPVFRRHNAPFAVNVTTSLVGCDDNVWWYRLEDLVLQREEIILCDENNRRIESRTLSQKEDAFMAVCRAIRRLDATRRGEFLRRFWETNAVTKNTRPRLMMDWGEVCRLAADPLATIGAHTVNHFDSVRLTDAELLSELNESRAIIESRIGKPVAHFAFPFGGANAVGAREFALAKKCGFKTAVTTRSANLFPAHSDHLECLPRLGVSGNYAPVPERFWLVQSGLPAAFENRFRRVVTA